ncbi:MAG: hypothetical protein Fur0012_09990 [Elusimicrobiota bacterium]
MSFNRLVYFLLLSLSFAGLSFFIYGSSDSLPGEKPSFQSEYSTLAYEGNSQKNRFAPIFRMAPVSSSPDNSVSSTQVSTEAIVAQMAAAASAASVSRSSATVQVSSSSVISSQVITSTMSYFNPTKGRDPTLSPQDYYTIKKKKEEIERLKMEREKQTRVKNNQEMPRVHLQGIVGKSAIINGEMVNEGQKYKGFKVVKVGYDYIIGNFNGKTYRINIE